MQLRFNIQDTLETEIFYGFYEIFILGGHAIDVSPAFYIEITNLATGATVTLNEKYLKARDYKLGCKAVKWYSFEIQEYGKFKVAAHHYEGISVKNSILLANPISPFKMLFGSFFKPLDVSEIEILIE